MLDPSWQPSQLDPWWVGRGHEGKAGVEENAEMFGLSWCKDGVVIT